MNITVNSYDPAYGIFLGELPDPNSAGVKGRVYLINETALQIVNFSYNGEAPGRLSVPGRPMLAIFVPHHLLPSPLFRSIDLRSRQIELFMADRNNKWRNCLTPNTVVDARNPVPFCAHDEIAHN